MILVSKAGMFAEMTTKIKDDRLLAEHGRKTGTVSLLF